MRTNWVIGGISVGDSALKSMNLEAAKMPVLANSVALCRKLLAGESFAEGKTAQLSHLGPPVPIYVAARGPKMLELAGRIADGVILMNGIAPELIREAVRIVGEGRRAAAREEGSVKIAVWAACHSNPKAVKFNVARAILRNIPGQVDEFTRQVTVKVKRAYDFRQHGSAQADCARLIPDELVAIPAVPKIAPRDGIMRELETMVASMDAPRSHAWSRAK